ncbi:hypothetical protein AAHC03_026150 [Spirometra sp. Aus1]
MALSFSDSFVRYCHQTVGQEVLFEAVRPMDAERSVNSECHIAEETSYLHCPHYVTTEIYAVMTQRTPQDGQYEFFGSAINKDHQTARVAQLCSCHGTFY